jgi:hypothetical protein
MLFVLLASPKARRANSRRSEVYGIADGVRNDPIVLDQLDGKVGLYVAVVLRAEISPEANLASLSLERRLRGPFLRKWDLAEDGAARCAQPE